MASLPEFNVESKFDFWGVLNRRKWIIFLGMLTGLLLGTLYHYKTPSQYQSVAKFSIQPKDQGFIRLSQLTPQSGLPSAADVLPTRHDKYVVQRELIKECCDTYNLYTKTSYISITKDETIDKIQDNLEVLPDKEDPWLFSLYFRAASPVDSQSVLNNLTETYRNRLEKKYASETTTMIDKYKEHALVYEQKLKDKENEILSLPNDDLVAPRDSNGMDIHASTIRQLDPQIAESKVRLMSLTTTRDRVLQAMQDGPEAMAKEVWKLEQDRVFSLEKDRKEAIQVEKARTYEWMLDDIAKAEIEFEEIKQRYGSGHHRYESAEKRVAKFRKMYDERVAAAESETPLENNTIPPGQILEWQIEKFNSLIEELQVGLQDLMAERNIHVEAEARLVDMRQRREKLNQEREFIRQKHNEITNQIMQLSPTGDLDSERFAENGFIFEIQQEPSQGELVWPILPAVLAIGGLIGSLLGFGLGCLVDLADKTFHNPDEVIRALGLPLVGHIPVISQSKRYQLENSIIEPSICTYHRPKSQVSEAYRAVRTALFFNAQGSKSSVIQVTSPTPGDGKSTTAANLAVSIAQSGKRVLLVDGDMRRPRMAQTFGMSSKEGFSTVLSGESFWKDVIVECPEIEGLSIMPCGLKPSNPAELVTSPQVKLLIDQMRNEYDFVVIDTPPLLAVTDPCPIAARVDGVVICMRIKKNVRISAERAVEVLRNVGANIVGVVVNGVGAQSGYGSQYTYGAYRAGYSYNGYGYGYGYGYGTYYDEKNAASVRPGTHQAMPRIEEPKTDDQPVEL
ncbi:MAG: polysaccharide biosynthesis tyrosine autokinase [Pirellulaceae bacterium]